VGVAGVIDGDAAPATLAAGAEADADGLDAGTGGGALVAEPPVEQATTDPAAMSRTTIAIDPRVSTTIAESSPCRRCLANAAGDAARGHIVLR
jgi:hypothetical protein